MPTRRVPLVVQDIVFETSLEEPFHPEVSVDLGDLMGPDGNAFWVLGKVMRALREAGVDDKEYHDAATNGDYEHLLFVTRSWVRVFEHGPGRPQDL